MKKLILLAIALQGVALQGAAKRKLEYDPVVSIMDGSPVHEAVVRGDRKAVRRLLKKRPLAINHPDWEFKTPLHYAAKEGNIEMLKLLLSRLGVDLAVGDIREETPLHLAIIGGHLEAAEMLLKKGAKPNARNAERQTPVHLAAARGNLEALKLLKRYGASIKAFGKNLSTALHWAASGGHPKVVIWLIDSEGIGLEWSDNKKQTALHWAAQEAQLGVVRALLLRDANPKAKNMAGQTPLDVAWLSAAKRRRQGKPPRVGESEMARLLAGKKDRPRRKTRRKF